MDKTDGADTGDGQNRRLVIACNNRRNSSGVVRARYRPYDSLFTFQKELDKSIYPIKGF